MSDRVICRRCPAFGEWHFEHADNPGCIVDVVTVDDARAQRIRDIVAQQWAVAWVILEGSLPLLQTWEFDGLVGEELAKQWDVAFAEVVHDAFRKHWPSTPLARRLAALPSAAEIVGGEP